MGNCCGGPQGPVATTTTTITTGSGRPRTSTDRVAAASRSEARQQRQAQIVESERLASERGNLPLSAEPLQWKSSAPVKKAAILKRRLEFWDTAPAYEGQREIWDALKAAAETEDRTLAQAILDSAGIKIPKGNLTVAYDERGTRYVVPPFCLSFPSNMAPDDDGPGAAGAAAAAGATAPESSAAADGVDIEVKVRLSIAKDLLLAMKDTTTIGEVKRRVQQEDGAITVGRQRVFFCGKQIPDNVAIKAVGLGKMDVLQVLVF
eukprot:m.229125 g.229125  ORF g.229125 m.229125 type:complete len:263 (+) comp18836_c2_seq6:168-956(+)